jgi:hypothetical protein
MPRTITYKNNPPESAGCFFSGAEGRARTGDPILFRDMLYQLSYLGVFIFRPTKTATSAYINYFIVFTSVVGCCIRLEILMLPK